MSRVSSNGRASAGPAIPATPSNIHSHQKMPGDRPWLLEPRLTPQQFIYITLRTFLYVAFRQRFHKLRGHLPAREAQRAVVPPRVRQRRGVPAPHEGAVYHDDVEWLPTASNPHRAAQVARLRR